jgi:hypothetical protein
MPPTPYRGFSTRILAEKPLGCILSLKHAREVLRQKQAQDDRR